MVVLGNLRAGNRSAGANPLAPGIGSSGAFRPPTWKTNPFSEPCTHIITSQGYVVGYLAGKPGNVYQSFWDKTIHFGFQAFRLGSSPPSLGAAAESLRRQCRSPSAATPEGGRPQTPTRRSSTWLSPDVGNNFPAHHAGATPFPRLKEFTQRPEAVVYERTIPPTRCAGHRRGPTKRARPMLTHRVPSRTNGPDFPGAQSPLHKGGFGAPPRLPCVRGAVCKAD